MEAHTLFTSESVSRGHPDKAAIPISDVVVVFVMAREPGNHFVCEPPIGPRYPAAHALAHDLVRRLSGVRRSGAVLGRGPGAKSQIKVRQGAQLGFDVHCVLPSQQPSDWDLRDLRRGPTEQVIVPSMRQIRWRSPTPEVLVDLDEEER
jgi:S-adenosylmethionine synthetase